MRKDKLEHLAATGKVTGIRERGRRRTLFTDQLVKSMNCQNTIRLFKKIQKVNSLLLMYFNTALEKEEDNIERDLEMHSTLNAHRR